MVTAPRVAGASKLNRTDMFFGDLSTISDEDLDHIDQIVMDNLVSVPKEEGDVVLVDNYQVMQSHPLFAAHSSGDCP